MEADGIFEDSFFYNLFNEDVDDKQYKCVHCENPERTFQTMESFESHNHRGHPHFTRVCTECLNSFQTPSELEQHFNMNHSKKLRHKKQKKSFKKGGYTCQRKKRN